MNHENTRLPHGRIRGLYAAGLLLLPAGIVHAQAAPGAEQSSTTLQEVVVTARRREEPLQSVPLSVAALTASDLEERSLVSLQDVGQSTANVSFYNMAEGGNTSGLVFIRGIGQTDMIVTNDPGVGIYVDGVYIGRMQGIDLDMMDVQRIEVLRGPQGTLFGKNTIGGAINIVSNEPSLQEVTGDAQITTGSYDRIDGIGRLSLPLIPQTLAVSLSAATRNQDGYGERLLTGQRMGNIDEQSARLEVRFTPSDVLEFLLTGDVTHINEEQADMKLLAVNPTVPLVGLLNLVSPTQPYDSRWLTSSDFKSYATGDNFNVANLHGASLTATWNAGPFKLKSITSYRIDDTNLGEDPDGSPLTLIDETDRELQNQFSEELQLSGDSFGSRLTWVGGLYYFGERASQYFDDQVFTALRAIGLDASFNTNVAANNKAYAVYGQGTLAFTDQFHLTLGVRETAEHKIGSVFRYAPFSGDAVLIPFTQKSASWDSFTPRVSLDYQFTHDIMAYVSAASGFKSGGFNGRANVAAGLSQYGPETAWTYEAGVRSDLLDKHLRVNATAYYTDYKNIQYTIVQGTVNGQPNIVQGNAAAARIDGGELEFDVVPVQHLTLSATAGLTDARYTEVAPGTQGITTASPFVYTPKWTGNIGGEYLFTLPAKLELVAHADWVYRSKAYFSLPVTPYVTQGGYGTVDARLTLRTSDKRWSIAAFGTNLTNKYYMTGASDLTPTLGFATGFFAPPREWGATFEYHF